MGCASSSQVQDLQDQIEALKEQLLLQQANAKKDVLDALEQVKRLVTEEREKDGLKVEHVEISKKATSDEDIQAKIEKKQERLRQMVKAISDTVKASPKAQSTEKSFPRSITLKLEEIEATVGNLTSPKARNTPQGGPQG